MLFTRCFYYENVDNDIKKSFLFRIHYFVVEFLNFRLYFICKSIEVLDLSRRQMTTGKNSKAEIAHVPPKRIKMGDFIYTPKSSNSRRHESSSSNSNADLNVIQRKGQKRTQLQQLKLPLAPLQNNPKPNQREKDGVGNQETNTTVRVLLCRCISVVLFKRLKRNLTCGKHSFCRFL